MAAHDQRTPTPGIDRFVQTPTGKQIQIVGRLIQQQHIEPFHQQRHQTQQNTLPTGKTTNGPVQIDMTQPQSSQTGQGTLLHIPVITNDREVFLVDLTGLDGMQRRPFFLNTQNLIDTQIGIERDILRQIRQPALNTHRTTSGQHIPTQQTKQGGFSRTVGTNQTGTTPINTQRQPVEDRSTVRQDKRQVRTRHKSMRKTK